MLKSKEFLNSKFSIASSAWNGSIEAINSMLMMILQHTESQKANLNFTDIRMQFVIKASEMKLLVSAEAADKSLIKMIIP